MKHLFFLITVTVGLSNAGFAKTTSKRTPTSEVAAAAPASGSTTNSSSTSPTATASTANTSGTSTTVSASTVPTKSMNSANKDEPFLVSRPFDSLPLIHISTNFVDFTAGKTNFLIDFLNHKKKFHVNIRSYTSSEQEWVAVGNGESKYTVVRSALGLGFTWYAKDLSAAQNWVISPALVFGKTDDPFKTSSQAGIGIKASALYRMGERATFEAGLLGDNIHSGHRSMILLSFGYFL